jgi:drug/metabolite transporter (DMT)-like permease
MPKPSQSDLQYWALQLGEILLAGLLVLAPLFLYWALTADPNTDLTPLKTWRGWALLAVIGVLPSCCGFVWLIQIYRKRRAIARMPDEE